MAKPSDKDPEKKPFMTLSRKAAGGWSVVVFIISAWMFVMGVMVGRGTAPVSFDIDQLKKTLESAQRTVQQKLPQIRPRPEAAEMKNKADLGFYDSLPKSREETETLNLTKSLPALAKTEPPAQKPAESAAPPKAEKPAAVPAPASAPAAPPPAAPAQAAPGKPLTVQIAAVKTEEEARRLLEKLRQRGYGAYIEPIATPDKGAWYRLRMGEFPSKEFARSTVDRLQKDGFKPDIVPK
jgi:cell division septation protein DedD